MGGCRHVTKDAAKAVEEGRWATDYVMFCEEHPSSNTIAIVKDRAVAETGSLWKGSRARGKLYIDYVVWMEKLVREWT